MSKRRTFGEIVQAQDEDGQPPYLVKLIPTADGAKPDDCMYECGDPDRREWRIAEALYDWTSRPGSGNRPAASAPAF